MGKQRSHDEWANWSTEKIQEYLRKYCFPYDMGPRSNRRKKKIIHLNKILDKREEIARLIDPSPKLKWS